ncbi:MAG: hypothetical protein Q7T82_03020 [Armatimonadota bacterium]|nr:hypothetical protein [Armatimonadota bacterium]
MRKLLSFVLGVLSLVPLAYMFGFLSLMFLTIWSYRQPPQHRHAALSDEVMFETLLPIHLGMMLLLLILVAIYLVHLWRNVGLPEDKKALWAVALLSMGFVSMPVYWYLHIWRGRKEEERQPDE